MESHWQYKIDHPRLKTSHIETKYVQAKFDDLEDVVMEKNDALYGDAFND